jgi:cyclopropane fatty-acyl-phospholipid synthase-like methyltransferase
MERDNLMHGARTALNTNPDIREWAENFLKERSRSENAEMSDEEFEKYWKYHKPEIMHAGAAEAIQAYKTREK